MISIFKRSKKPAYPFSFLFKTLSPWEFFFSLKNEYPQTTAFILSFAPKQGYIKKVIALMQDEDTKRAILDYLNSSPRRSRTYDPDFVAAIEAEAQKMLNLQPKIEKLRENNIEGR